MESTTPDVTFFVPCLNEEKNVCATFDNILAATSQVPVAFEILVYDDCSTDQTVAVCEAYAAKHPEANIRIERNATHQGLGHNYRAGSAVASGRHYMLVNGDNVERVEVIAAVLSRLGEADIVIPYFGKLDTRPFHRIAVSRAFARLVNLLSGTRVQYYNGAVLHRRENVASYHTGARGFAYQAEMIVRMIRDGASYVEVEVPGEERAHGASRAFRPQNFISVGGSLLRIAGTRFRRPAREGQNS